MTRLITRKLMPLLMVAYVISFIDRTNIGLAKTHLEADMGISAAAFGLGAGLFFLAYSLCEVPSNLLMHRFGARFWITRIMVTWGLLSAGMAFVQGETSFYVMRVLLGIAEAGFFPGVMLYLTYWFTRRQRAAAMGTFLAAVPIANIIGAPLSGAILGLDGVAGLQGWQWMFLLEGMPAVVLAVVVWKLLPDGPRDAPWLSEEQAGRLEAHLEAEQEAGAAESGTHSFAGVFRDKFLLMTIAIYFCHQIAVYSLTYFLPTIIESWGEMDSFTVGLITALPWVASAAGALLLPRHATNAARSRTILVGGLAAMTAGLLIAAVAPAVVAILGFCLTAACFFVVQPIMFAVPSTRLSGATLAGGIALMNTIGILGGFVGPYVMGLLEEATGSAVSGLWFVAALVAVGALLGLRFPTRDPEFHDSVAEVGRPAAEAG
ncbi:MFS transporter [Saccharopolyspora rhizosphaerae]|uniref:MFS transporter n=1 Tax=Saccharopolyspora rhizosphaerae TaxID=2492662 RepID=A0A3R8Q547_9PSEU|nr:MFS transporter [Saccharopolyspora rhizosphaerae]